MKFGVIKHSFIITQCLSLFGLNEKNKFIFVIVLKGN